MTLEELRMELRSFDPAAAAAMDVLFEFESAEWVTVAEYTPAPGTIILSYLCDPSVVPKALRQAGFDLQVGHGGPYMNGDPDDLDNPVEYRRVGDDASATPLVFLRRFDRLSGVAVAAELSEDFRLFWNLYEDRPRGEFVLADENGDRVVVARQTGTNISIKKSFLRRYQAARQMTLVVQAVVERDGGPELAAWSERDEEVHDADSRVVYRGMHQRAGEHATRLLAKRAFGPPTQDQSDVWPFERPREYETFIIGRDGDGAEIQHSCDPDHLANNFGGNAGAPPFLTPVHFDRRVLTRYYEDGDKYRVEDGIVFGPSWVLPMDDGKRDSVIVFLGDLGENLPNREQLHWKAHNINGDGKLSRAGYERSILGEFSDSELAEHRFYVAYAEANASWTARFGWPLYLEPHEGDAHLNTSVHVPTNETFQAFDSQLTPLAKLVVDSLNEAEIVVATASPAAGEKGIAKLERLLQERDITAPRLLTNLRSVQGARSHSSAHRKGASFDEATLRGSAGTLPELFEQYLSGLASGYDDLRSAL